MLTAGCTHDEKILMRGAVDRTYSTLPLIVLKLDMEKKNIIGVNQTDHKYLSSGAGAHDERIRHLSSKARGWKTTSRYGRAAPAGHTACSNALGAEATAKLMDGVAEEMSVSPS
jgi:hypothetical protein